MGWVKKGLVFAPDGSHDWARHSFMTPCPWQRDEDTIRLFGGMRDDRGISRIGWVDVDASDPLQVKAVSAKPAIGLGTPGMFDDNGMILGDVLEVAEDELRLYYVGFQLVEKAKFLAFSGLAVSRDRGNSFKRVQQTPVIDRCPEGAFIGALHSIAALPDGTYRAWISRGFGWQDIGGRLFPQYDCWTLTSKDGIRFDNASAQRIIAPAPEEYRIGRPRANQLADGSWELRATSDTLSKQYASFRFTSPDGVSFTRTGDEELPRGGTDAWDGEMTCYPARIDTEQGRSYLFYNGNDMGATGVGVAVLED
ncbi:hypothetical protein [Leisingera methylohalidivorans]|uniref:Glycosyl hydrolase family 32 N-terminal domain-containing protein n=1 Tax=Leisingera methylohalidivorans DSM 14336 TaxID=999552 RepID=V9VVJ6_9RHOB|nr:hypothetical protein [Leisingera methylohalidivorans]AHD01729.1 hypothetical protein METH_14415 [Leisingera methylohalidivorans DSM 14336]